MYINSRPTVESVVAHLETNVQSLMCQKSLNDQHMEAVPSNL